MPPKALFVSAGLRPGTTQSGWIGATRFQCSHEPKSTFVSVKSGTKTGLAWILICTKRPGSISDLQTSGTKSLVTASDRDRASARHPLLRTPGGAGGDGATAQHSHHHDGNGEGELFLSDVHAPCRLLSGKAPRPSLSSSSLGLGFLVLGTTG